MKKKVWFFSPLTLMPCGIVSCVALNSSLPSIPDIEENKINLTFPNYFEKFNNNAYENRNELKSKITSIFSKYHLNEWNEYYENQKLSNVLNINLSDYDQKTQGSEVFDWSELGFQNNISTKIYNKQDKQFQYINDFINLINEENTKNQEDFLYLRWLYFSLFGAQLYQLKVGLPINFIPNQKASSSKPPIHKINVHDWIKAISKTIVEVNPQDLLEIIYTFFVYYGIVPDVGKFQQYIQDMNNELKKPGQIIQNFAKEFEKIQKQLGKDFWKKINDFYQKLRKKYQEVHNKDLKFYEFIKNIKELANEFQDISKEFKDIIDKWLSLTNKDEILNLIHKFENILKDSMPNIKLPDFINDWKLTGLQNSVLHAQLCSKDMLMRLLSKNDIQDSNYSLWKEKKKRAFEIYKKMVYYSNLLVRSFLVNENEISEIIINSLTETIDKYFGNNLANKLIKEMMEKLVEDTLMPIVKQIFDLFTNTFRGLLDKTIGELRLVYINTNLYIDKK